MSIELVSGIAYGVIIKEEDFNKVYEKYEEELDILDGEGVCFIYNPMIANDHIFGIKLVECEEYQSMAINIGELNINMREIDNYKEVYDKYFYPILEVEYEPYLIFYHIVE